MKYTKSQINSAGKALANKQSSAEKIDEALTILNQFRASHKYPLLIFNKRLKRISEEIDKNALTVQRLKRLTSIVNKLNRSYYGNKPSMKLSRMQDIAGCRTVVRDIELAKKLCKIGFVKSNIKHEKVNEKDYITYPKKDGYRSIHLIYKYKSDKGKDLFNGLLVEVQIRTKLQHLWATAVEIVDFFTNQSLKLNQGKEDWKDFFRLVSSAFALMEKSPLVPNTPLNKMKLYSLIKKKEKELQVIKIMKKWKEAIRRFRLAVKERPNLKFFLLELDLNSESLKVSGYQKKDEDKAIEKYSKLEKKNKGKVEYDIVLVGANTTKDLEKAYPNYFIDADDFLEKLKVIIDKV